MQNDNNDTPISTTTGERSNSHSSSFFSDDEDEEENSSVSDSASVSSCYEDEDIIVVLDGLDTADDLSSATCGFDMMVADRVDDDDTNIPRTGKGLQPKRWDSIKSVGQLGRSNPEVDEYVCWGVAR